MVESIVTLLHLFQSEDLQNIYNLFQSASDSPHN